MPDYEEPAWRVTKCDLCPTSTQARTSLKQGSERMWKTRESWGLVKRGWKGGLEEARLQQLRSDKGYTMQMGWKAIYAP